jgi:thioredoxin 1
MPCWLFDRIAAKPCTLYYVAKSLIHCNSNLYLKQENACIMAKETFGEIIKGDTPVLVDFTAEWCGPCKTMKPVLDELHQIMGETLRILKIDVDRNHAVASSLNISGVPTLMLYKNGKVLWRQSGVQSARQLQTIIQQKTATAL